jgi:hypothetical protein
MQAGKLAKEYPFAGSWKGLKTGNKYSLPYFAEVAGINSKTLASRIRAKQCKIITNYDLRDATAAFNNDVEKPFESRLESATDIVSQKWLSKSLL